MEDTVSLAVFSSQLYFIKIANFIQAIPLKMNFVRSVSNHMTFLNALIILYYKVQSSKVFLKYFCISANRFLI